MRKLAQKFVNMDTPLDEVSDISAILAKLALGQLIGKKLDKTLRQQPGTVVMLEVPSEVWATCLRRQLNLDYADVVAQVYRDGKRSIQSSEDDTLITTQRGGGAVIAISTDIEGLVPLSLRVAADVTLGFDRLTPLSLRKAIAEITGYKVRGVRAEDTALDLADLCAALRPGAKPADCLRRLRRAAVGHQAVFAQDVNTPPVTSLPLNAAMREWSNNMLVRLQQLKTGALTSREAPFTLLAGPPGTGKTLMAQAIAQSAGWRFVGTSVSAWFEKSDGNLGGVTRAAAEFFQQVEMHPHTIGFMDELDALPDRSSLDPEHRQWWTSLITGVLLKIDALRRCSNPVVLLAASNYPLRIDGAMLRSGRIGEKVMVYPPRTRPEIAALFQYYAGENLSTSQLQRVTDFAFALGLPTPASIEAWVGIAKARALAADREITGDDVERAIAGQDSRRPADLYRVAIHEAGHAIVAHVLGIPVNAVSIVMRGDSGGSMVSDLSAFHMDRTNVEDLVTTALAGRAADIELRGNCDAAASNDLVMATQLLFDAQFRFGLFDQLLAFGVDASRLHELDHASRTSLENRLQQLMQRSRALVTGNRAAIERLAQRLLENRVVSGEEVRRIAGDPKAPDPGAPTTKRLP